MSDDLDERVAPPMDVLSKSRLARLKDMGAGTLVGEMAARITELEAENTTLLDLHSKAMKSLTSQVLKRRELEAELAEWEKLKDPINLHVNLLRGVPCRLDRMQHLLHLAGATDYDDLRAVREAIYQVAVQIGKEMDK